MYSVIAGSFSIGTRRWLRASRLDISRRDSISLRSTRFKPKWSAVWSSEATNQGKLSASVPSKSKMASEKFGMGGGCAAFVPGRQWRLAPETHHRPIVDLRVDVVSQLAHANVDFHAEIGRALAAEAA